MNKPSPTSEMHYNEEAFSHLCLAFQHLEKTDEQLALQEVTLALEIEPLLLPALCVRISLFSDAGRYDEALIDLNTAAAHYPEDAIVLKTRGRLLMSQHRYVEAIPDFNRVLELLPTDPEILNRRGVARTRLYQLDEAIADLSKAIEIEPDNSDHYVQRAIALMKKQDEHFFEDMNRAELLSSRKALYKRYPYLIDNVFRVAFEMNHPRIIELRKAYAVKERHQYKHTGSFKS